MSAVDLVVSLLVVAGAAVFFVLRVASQGRTPPCGKVEAAPALVQIGRRR